MSKPLVSICIPTFNREQYLAQTIESALSQDYENIEVIVADNCSSDNTQELVKQYSSDKRFFYYRNETNVGMVNNWKGLLDNKVAGEWFLLLSDDDYLIEPSYISEAMAIAKNHPDVNMIYANGYLEHVATKHKEALNLPFREIEDGKRIFLNNHTVKPQAFTLCNILFRTQLSKQLNAFSNPNNLFCDSELFLKTCLTGKVGVVKKYVSVYRFHSSNLVTQQRSFEELISIATDLFIAPQVKAKEMGEIPDADLKEREKNVVIPALKNMLFCISMLDPKLLDQAVSRLQGKGIELDNLFNDPIFLLKIYITKSTKLYRFLRMLKKSLFR